jgi:hypothetical protein
VDEARPLKILRLRAEIGELGGAIHQHPEEFSHIC